MGVLRMTKEHLAIALALKVPVVVAITKIDRAPAHVYEATVTHIQKLLKSPGARKLPVLVKSADELAMCAQNIVHDRVVPIFSVSNVTGEGLDLLRGFLNLAPSRRNWAEYRSSPTEFAIDETFLVPGVGTVVSGTCSAGSVGVGQSLSLGPDHSGAYVSVIVKSVRLALLNSLRFAGGMRGGAVCARLSGRLLVLFPFVCLHVRVSVLLTCQLFSLDFFWAWSSYMLDAPFVAACLSSRSTTSVCQCGGWWLARPAHWR